MGDYFRARKKIIWFGILILGITTLPYLVGYHQQGQAWRFTGFVFGVEDGNSYIAKMLSGENGMWLFQTPYTAFHQKGLFAFFPYLLLGKLVSPPGLHEQLVALYHIFRWMAGIMVFLAAYDFVSLFIKERSLVTLATTLIAVGGGTGWLSLAGLGSLWSGRLPLEYYSPESFGFLSVFGIPHLAMARALMLWGFALYLDPQRHPLAAGVIWLVMSLFQPLTVVTSWVLVAVQLALFYLFSRRKNDPENIQRDNLIKITQRAMIAILVSSPIVIYTFISFQIEPFLKEWASQNRLPSPPVGDYLLSYALFLIISILGIIKIFGHKKSSPELMEGTLLAAWIIAFPFLAYLPYPVQRRLPDGVWVAIIVLYFIAIKDISKKWRKRLITVSLTGFITPIFLVAGAIMAADRPSLPLFRPAAETAAFKFLNESQQRYPVVLCEYETGNALPAWAPVRVVIGHGPESIHFSHLKPLVTEFYSGTMDDKEQITFIKDQDIDYIFWGPKERTPNGWYPETAEYLEKVYEQDGYAIYRVLESGS